MTTRSTQPSPVCVTGDNWGRAIADDWNNGDGQGSAEKCSKISDKNSGADTAKSAVRNVRPILPQLFWREQVILLIRKNSVDHIKNWEIIGIKIQNFGVVKNYILNLLL